MNTELMKVVQQGETFAVQSQKAEGGQIKKMQHPVAGTWRQV